MEVTIPALFKNNTAQLPNGSRYPLVGGSVDSPPKRDSAQARKLLKNAPRTHLSTARIVSPLVNGCAITIFFSITFPKFPSKNIYGNQGRRPDGTEQQSFGFHRELFLIM